MKKSFLLFAALCINFIVSAQCGNIEDCLKELNSKVGTTYRYESNRTYNVNFRFYEDRITFTYSNGLSGFYKIDWSEIWSLFRTYLNRISISKEPPAGYQFGWEQYITPNSTSNIDEVIGLMQKILKYKGLGHIPVYVGYARDLDQDYYKEIYKEQGTATNTVKAEEANNKANSIFNEQLKKYKKSNSSAQARINLIFVHDLIETQFYYYSKVAMKRNYVDIYGIPQGKEYSLDEAVSDGNADAILYKYGRGIKNEDGLAKIKGLAEKGNKDAMIILGRYYNQKKRLYYYDFKQGNDAKQALYWFTKAADAGCPMGMYCLGMIYKYKELKFDYTYSKDKGSLKYVKYKVDKDAGKAFKYFLNASLLEKYEPSNYAKFERLDRYQRIKNVWPSDGLKMNHGASIFEPNIFEELSKFYSEKNSLMTQSLEKAGEYSGKAKYWDRIFTNSEFNFVEYINTEFNYSPVNWYQLNTDAAVFSIDSDKPDNYIMQSKKSGIYYSDMPTLSLESDFIFYFDVKLDKGKDNSYYGIYFSDSINRRDYYYLKNDGSTKVIFGKKLYTESNIDTAIMGNFIGIGIRTENKGTYPQVRYVRDEFEASNKIDAGDLILKMKEGDGNVIDLKGVSADSLNFKFYGKAGTTIHLTIQKTDGKIMEVSLLRKLPELHEWSFEKYGDFLFINVSGTRIVQQKIKNIKKIGFFIYQDKIPIKIEIQDFRIKFWD